MNQKTALITGASRGIGRAVAGLLAERGYRLVLVARKAATLDDVAATLRHVHKADVQTVAVDLADAKAVQAALAPVLAQLPRLDVLVNSAGIFRFGTDTLGMDDMQALLATNVQAVHQVCGLCLPLLRAAQGAHVFNVASIAGIESFAPIAGYAASKHALVGYTQSLARALVSEGIRVTALCPDVVDTDMGAPSGLPREQMIATADLCRAIDFVMSLSPAAVVDQLTIRCRTIMEMGNTRG